MKATAIAVAFGVWVAGAAAPVLAQQISSAAVAPPILIPLAGQLQLASGEPRTGPARLVLAIYSAVEDVTPLWSELQPAMLGAAGQYAVQFGATRREGLPPELFASGAARWVSVSVEGEPEGPRMMLTATAYASKAAVAETLAGRPASEFVSSQDLRDQVKAALANREGSQPVTAAGDFDFAGIMATSGVIPKYTDGAGTLGDSVISESSGKIGIGSAPFTPGAGLEVWYGGVSANRSGGFVDGFSDGLAVAGWWGMAYQQATNKLVVGGYRVSQWLDLGLYTNGSERVRIDPTGKVGIGTTTPETKLHVAGDLKVDGNIAAKYQDVAEWVDSSEDLEAGTIVVIDETGSNRVRAAANAYDTAVAGAVSAQPGVVLGEDGPGRELVAQSGRVRIKVDATFGPITAGDLLVTSPTPGHAMKSEALDIGGHRMHRPGTLIGKALESLAAGRGEILVLLTLQ